MKYALFVLILSLCSAANAVVPDLPVVGVNTNNLRAAVGSGYGGAPGYIATVDLDGAGVYDGFVQDAQSIYGNIPVGTYLSTFRLDRADVSHAGANWVNTFKIDSGTPGNDFWGFDAEGVCSLFPHSLCVYNNDNINLGLYTTNAGTVDSFWNAFDYRIAMARYLYCANLDAMLNYTNNGFGMHYVFTDEWTPGGIWGPCDPDNSLYLTFASEISAVLHNHDIAHVLNCGITLGIDADGPNAMSRANFLLLCSQVDGLTFEHPCDDDVITSTAAVNRMLDYLSYASQSGVCTILFPANGSFSPHGQPADFLAALAMYVQGPLVGWTQSYDPSWSNWPTVKGRRTSAIGQFVNGATHYAYYSNGWWLTINFGNFTYNWTTTDPRPKARPAVSPRK